jgi:hypothetical protein
MRAAIEDKIVVRGHSVGEQDRKAVLLAAGGTRRRPAMPGALRRRPHEGVFFPEADAVGQHYPHK